MRREELINTCIICVAELQTGRHANSGYGSGAGDELLEWSAHTPRSTLNIKHKFVLLAR